MKPILLACGVILLALPADAEAQTLICPGGRAEIRVVDKPGYPGGGRAAYDNFGPVIFIDSNLILAYGHLMYDFMVAHELGHHCQGHVTPDMQLAFAQNPSYAAWQTQAIELEADCWAARWLKGQGNYPAISGAANVFVTTQGPFNGAPYYPSGYQRAAKIRECAGI